MLEVLKISQVIIWIFLILVVLIQNKNVSLNLASMWGGMWAVSKRGPEKVLFQITVVLWVLFVVNSVAYFLLAR